MDSDVGLDSFRLSIKNDPKKGRCTVAQRSFKPGEVILRSSSFAALLQSQVTRERCHECFESAHKLLLCGGCKRARYCCKECQKNAWKLHKYECAAESILKTGPQDDTSQDEQRFLFRAAIAYALSKAEDAEEASYELLDGEISIIPSREDFEELDDHFDDLQKDNAKFTAARATAERCRTALLQCRSKFASLEVPDVETLCKWVSAFECNNFSMWDSLILPIASGCFPIGALLNHSCAPNCVLQYDLRRRIQVIRCIREVAVGEELCHSYLDVAMTTQSRREWLSQQYYFLCRCSLCENKDHNRDRSLTSCSAKDRAAMEEMMASSSILERATALDAMSPSVERATIQVCSRLHTALIEAGEYEADVKVLAEIIGAYKLIYPANHPLIGLNLYTLGSVLLPLGRQSDASAALEEALTILLITHGERCALVQQLRNEIDDLHC